MTVPKAKACCCPKLAAARGPKLAGSSPPFLDRERAAVSVDVDPERRSRRYHDVVYSLDDALEQDCAERRC